MNLLLVRHAYLPECTLGMLRSTHEALGLLELATIERPWIVNPEGPGGLLTKSCIPDGTYNLAPHDTERFPGTYALINSELGVYHQLRPEGQTWGRTAILIHAANWAHELLGCIAVGLTHGRMSGKDAVLDSQAAMSKLRAALGRQGAHQITIRPTLGTKETVHA